MWTSSPWGSREDLPSDRCRTAWASPFEVAHVLEFAHLVLPLVIACPWASHSTSPCFSFFFCKMGTKCALGLYGRLNTGSVSA